MSFNNPVKFGTKSFAVISAGWDRRRQECEIVFEDDNGIRYKAIALGASGREIRQAVFDAARDMWIEAQGDQCPYGCVDGWVGDLPCQIHYKSEPSQ